MNRLARIILIVAALPAIVATSASAGTAPDPASLALLRRYTDHRSIRLHLDSGTFVVHDAVFDTGGVSFDPATIEGQAHWVDGDKLAPATPSPRLAWNDITAIDRGEPRGLAGALLGLALVPVAICVWPHDRGGEDWTLVYAIASAPLGFVAGAFIGAGTRGWRPVWRHPAAGRDDR